MRRRGCGVPARASRLRDRERRRRRGPGAVGAADRRRRRDPNLAASRRRGRLLRGAIAARRPLKTNTMADMTTAVAEVEPLPNDLLAPLSRILTPSGWQAVEGHPSLFLRSNTALMSALR